MESWNKEKNTDTMNEEQREERTNHTARRDKHSPKRNRTEREEDAKRREGFFSC
jgi:hypothetical protein